MKGEAAEIAPPVAARRWLQHRAGVEVFDARPPTRIVGREELRCPDWQLYLRWCIACKCNGRRDDPTILHDRGRKTHSRSVPLLLDFSLEGALRKTSWIADRAFGVVTTRLRFAVKVKTTDFEEVVKLAQPDKYTKFRGELWGVSGQPFSWGPDVVTDFLAGGKGSLLNTFRQGYRRTGVALALEQPMSTKLQHELGLAVIKRVAMQKSRPNSEIQKWMPASDWRKTRRDTVFSQTWAAVVATPAQKIRKADDKKGQQRRLEHPSQAQHMNLNTTPTAMDFGDVVQALSRPSAVIPMMDGRL